MQRLVEILVFLLMALPVILLIVKVMEWTDGPYLILVFFLSSAIIKLLMIVVYPILIAPLTGKIQPLPHWADPIKDQITVEAGLVS